MLSSCKFSRPCACTGKIFGDRKHFMILYGMHEMYKSAMSRLQRKPLVNNPGMPNGTCVTHVPWRMAGLLNGGVGENVPGIPSACATHNFTYLSRGLCMQISYSVVAPNSDAHQVSQFWLRVTFFLSLVMDIQNTLSLIRGHYLRWDD